MLANQLSILQHKTVMARLAPERRAAPKSAHAPNRKSARKRKAKAVLDRPALPPGWHSSDDHEITLRRWRGRTEILSVKALEPDHPYFGTFRAQSASGGSYEVEIRSLNDMINSCGCIDYRVNGLGTCKHIEGTIAAAGPRVFAPPRQRAVPESRFSWIAAHLPYPLLCGRQRVRVEPSNPFVSGSPPTWRRMEP
jgi:hypothetical protein